MRTKCIVLSVATALLLAGNVSSIADASWFSKLRTIYKIIN